MNIRKAIASHKNLLKRPIEVTPLIIDKIDIYRLRQIKAKRSSF